MKWERVLTNCSRHGNIHGHSFVLEVAWICQSTHRPHRAKQRSGKTAYEYQLVIWDLYEAKLFERPLIVAKNIAPVTVTGMVKI